MLPAIYDDIVFEYYYDQKKVRSSIRLTKTGILYTQFTRTGRVKLRFFLKYN